MVHLLPSARSASRKSSKSRTRLLRNELLEPRTFLSASGFSFPATWSYAQAAAAGIGATANRAPIVVQAITANGNAAVTGKTASLSVLGGDDGGEFKLTYTWSVTSSPIGSRTTFNTNGTNAAKNALATFTKAGTYSITVKIVDAGRLSVSTVKTVIVVQTATTLKNLPASLVNTTATSVQFVAPTFLDQFGSVMSTPALTWLATSSPLNSSAPRFTTSGSLTTVAFGMAGYYTLACRATSAPNVFFATAVNVNQALTSIVVSPNAATVLRGATQQFVARTLDQFGQAMANQQVVNWSTTGGTITAGGLLTAPGSGTSCTVTATSGSIKGTAAVTLLANNNTGTFRSAALAQLVQGLSTDGSINRLDMIQILRGTGADGVVDANEFADLKTLLTQSAALKIPGYVQVLAGDVINGSAANATFQGVALGNLAAGSSAMLLNKLVDKWFLGADHPALCNTSLAYRSAAGSLFNGTPSHNDERQGMLGDCYFISALGTIADSNPDAVRNMFIDNGDGTYTVRFYTGTYGTIYNYADGSISAGFKDNLITVDYVTVDRMLPVSSTGILAYSNYGAHYANTANTLWIPLAEKAYAQWNETGKAGRDGLNAYASIQGGWMATVDAQVLGHNATDYIMTRTSQQVAINALAAHKAVTIGTLSWSGTKDGLYATHAYAITGYNASTNTFTLFNPWNSNQPGQLTWSQLQADCSQLVVADTAGSLPIDGVTNSVVSAKTSSAHGASGPAAWLGMWGSSESARPRQFQAAGTARAVLSASLVDALLAGTVAA